jgi:hypothetical protein
MGSGVGAGRSSSGTTTLPSSPSVPGQPLGISPPGSQATPEGVRPQVCAPGTTDAACRERSGAGTPLSCSPGDHDCINSSGRTRRLP